MDNNDGPVLNSFIVFLKIIFFNLFQTEKYIYNKQ